MINVLIADDHAVVRSGLKQIMATTADIAVIGEAGNGGELLELLTGRPVDLVLLDMSMPGLAGVELIQRIRSRWPFLPLLVLSMHNDGQIVARALKSGANGYVTKDSEPEVLLEAIYKVAGGGRFIDPGLMDVMLSDLENAPVRPHQVLSAREFQVLTGILAGQSLGQIADQLCLSPKTVSTHKMRLKEKLGIDNNADLVRYGMRHGLADH